jgi:hypothetical protein
VYSKSGGILIYPQPTASGGIVRHDYILNPSYNISAYDVAEFVGKEVGCMPTFVLTTRFICEHKAGTMVCTGTPGGTRVLDSVHKPCGDDLACSALGQTRCCRAPACGPAYGHACLWKVRETCPYVTCSYATRMAFTPLSADGVTPGLHYFLFRRSCGHILSS